MSMSDHRLSDRAPSHDGRMPSGAGEQPRQRGSRTAAPRGAAGSRLRRFVASSLLLAFCLGTASGCVRNPATGQRQLLLASPTQVAAMGDAAAPELTVEYGGEIGVPQLRSYVTGVGAALTARTERAYGGIPWSFTLLDSDVINAFALPGGHVFVTRGLMERFTNEGQLAGVLGHEIGHVTARHVEDQISRTLLVQGLLGAVDSATESELAVLGTAMFANGYLLHFGREQEAQADELGVRYMVAAGYDPVAMLEVLDILQVADAGPRPPEFLSTHPYPETRRRTVRSLIEQQYQHTQGSPEYGTYPERFDRDAAPFLGPVTEGRPRSSGAPAAFCSLCGGPRGLIKRK